MQFVLIIIIGSLLFFLGSIVAEKVFWLRKNSINKKEYTIRSFLLIKIIIIVCFFCTILYLMESIKISKEFNAGGFLLNLRLAKNYGSSNSSILEYFGVLSNSLLAYMLILKEKIRIKIFFWYLISISVVVFTILATGRGFVFNILLICIAIYNFKYIDMGKEYKYVKKLSIILIFMIGIFFSYDAILKKGNENQSMNNLERYLAGNIQSLDYFLKDDIEIKYGENTFRLILKIKSIIKKEDKDYNLIDEYPNIENSNNTYTIYKTYIEDYGYLGLIIQFIIGFISTFMYLKGRYGCKSSRYYSAMLLFPLIMQIMLDQYFSLSSYWIQVIVYGVLFFKLNSKKVIKLSDNIN